MNLTTLAAQLEATRSALATTQAELAAVKHELRSQRRSGSHSAGPTRQSPPPPPPPTAEGNASRSQLQSFAVDARLSSREPVPRSIIVSGPPAACGTGEPSSAEAPQRVRVRWLIATMGKRDHFLARNRLQLPSLEPFRSTNGMNESEVHDFFDSHPQLRLYKLFTWTYGMLASWLTKYRALEAQVQDRVPYQAILEDDMLFGDGFAPFVERLAAAHLGPSNEAKREADRFNLVVLGRWGEGYVTSLPSARRVLAILDANGVRKNADIQWNDGSCGRIVQLQPHATPWSLLVRTSQGVMRKTGAIKSRHPIPRLRYDPLARARCHDYMPRATCAWAVERRLCADKRWNMTHCPTLCGHAVCRSKT